MEQHNNLAVIETTEINKNLIQIKRYFETDIHNLTKQLQEKDKEIKKFREDLFIVQRLDEGNRQLINKLLGDLSKLQNDVDWYKRTYEQRSFFGTIREKIFRRTYRPK